MQKHFQKEFDAELPNSLKLSPGKKRIIMLFKINKEGAIVGIKTKAPHPALQEEAVRIIKLLPIMKPGELNGKKVTVKYSITYGSRSIVVCFKYNSNCLNINTLVL